MICLLTYACKNQGYPNKFRFCNNQLDCGFCWFSTPTDQYKGGCLKLLALLQSQDGHGLIYTTTKKVCPKITLNLYIAANMGNLEKLHQKLIKIGLI